MSGFPVTIYPPCYEGDPPALDVPESTGDALRLAYDALWDHWRIMVFDVGAGRNQNPTHPDSCTCEPGDPCPAHRCHAAMVAVYRALTEGSGE